MVMARNSTVNRNRFSTAVSQRGVDHSRIYCSSPTKSKRGTILDELKEIAAVQMMNR